MIRVVRGQDLAALAACVSLASPVLAATCPTGPTGRWVVKEDWPDRIGALTEAEANRIRRHPILVSEKLVKFAGRKCPVSRIQTGRKDHSFDDPTDPEKWPGFETGYTYFCSSGEQVPGFWVGPSCDTILVRDDGVTFRLVRAESRGSTAPGKALPRK